MLHAAAIDTAQAIDELEAAGLDNKSARALVSVVNAAFTNTAATAADLREAEGRLEKQIIKQGAALDKRITEQGAAFAGRIAEVRTEIAEQGAAFEGRIGEVRTEIAEVRTEIAEVRTEIAEQGAALEGRIGEVRTEIAEVRTEIAESVNKTLRGMALLMGMALALGALWTAVVPAIRMALTGTP
ncbi:hypothetical protein [Tateyamaria sp.]|uniref:hypothetical protein n=1 Tax=Tateyamaria sp. TaxID=1929288 RepID=UPI003B20F222